MQKSTLTCFLTANNKKYKYVIEKNHNESTYIECKAANLAQEFLNEDLPNVIFSLPALILVNKKESKKKEVIRFRVSSEEKKIIQKKALERGYSTLSAF